jgi:Mitochondrial carrier protein
MLSAFVIFFPIGNIDGISTLVLVGTSSFDTIRRRMQVQSLHVPPEQRLNSLQQFTHLVQKEGLKSVYRGLTPELLKVVRLSS